MQKWFAIALLCACACGDKPGNGESGGDADTDTDADSDTDTDTDTGDCTYTNGPYPTTWAGVQEFFGDYCYRCHLTPSTYPGGAEPIDLVGDITADLQDPSYNPYIVEGHPEQSHLWLAVSGEDINLMPFDATEPLPYCERKVIEQWILAGAPQ
jgi:hypothetical protein